MKEQKYYAVGKNYLIRNLILGAILSIIGLLDLFYFNSTRFLGAFFAGMGIVVVIFCLALMRMNKISAVRKKDKIIAWKIG